MLIALIIGVLVLSVLVLVHELGHFITAKAVGVRVEEFGLGFPPRLLSIKRGETIYSLNAVPFGGFNRLAGEEDPGEPGSLASKGIGARLLVLSAGSLMNFLLPLLLLSIAFMVPFNVIDGQVKVTDVAPDSPAFIAGIETGDIVISVNDQPVRNLSDLHRQIQLSLGKEIVLLVRHTDFTSEELQVTPRWKPPRGQGATGIVVEVVNPTIVRKHYPFWEAIPLGMTEFFDTFVLYKNGIVSMVIGTVPGSLVGPVGIAQLTGEVAATGISPLLQVTAFISLILAIVNLFPIPAVDGGRIAFVLLEWVRRGKRVSPKIEHLVHSIGFALLMAILLIITYQDIIRIISGESIIP